MAVDSHTSATTPAAAPTQPHERPGAAAPPATADATPSPGGSPAQSSSAASSGSPTADVSPTINDAAATAPQTAAGDQTTAGDQQATDEQQPGFGSRGRRRRRARFLRKARELAYRDLGGLVFSLHRFGQRNDSLVLAKLATLSRIDAELRALEDSLGERQPVTVLREAGITACPRCAAIHSGEDRFCPGCGLSMSRRSDLPIAGAPAGGVAQAPSAPSPSQAPPAGSPLAAPPPTAQPPTPASAEPTPPTGSAASAAPATQQHAATAPPASDRAQPHAAPQPATQAFDAVPADGGAGDQPTEIIRPPAPGS
jgi:hypothetical protein